MTSILFNDHMTVAIMRPYILGVNVPVDQVAQPCFLRSPAFLAASR